MKAPLVGRLRIVDTTRAREVVRLADVCVAVRVVSLSLTSSKSRSPWWGSVVVRSKLLLVARCAAGLLSTRSRGRIPLEYA